MGACLFLSSSIFLRTPFGELVRALALSLILVLKRSHSIRKKYPTWKYVQGLLSYGSNQQTSSSSTKQKVRPFPPCPNPWNYQPQRPSDPEFNMLYSLIAMVFVGSTCGATLSLPLIPTWMASLTGAATLAVATTMDSPRGDLARTMGMRLVALIHELWNIQATLGIIPKAAIVSSQIIDKCMILDNQHKVKDKFLRLVNAGYEQILQQTSSDRVPQPQRPREKEDRTNKYGDRDKDPSSPTSRRRPVPMDEEEYATDDGRSRRRSAYDDNNDDDYEADRAATTATRTTRQGTPRPPPPPTRDVDDYNFPDREENRRDHGPTGRRGDDDDARESKDASPAKKKRGWFGR